MDKVLFVYSYCPVKYWKYSDGYDVASPVNIAGSVADLVSRKTAIIDAFNRSGLSQYANTLYSNLIDYVDEDGINSDLGAVSGEAHPMLNEVVFKNRVQLQTGIPSVGFSTYTIQSTLSFELWFPFAKHFGGQYSLQVGATCTPLGGTPSSLTPANLSFTNDFSVSTQPYIWVFNKTVLLSNVIVEAASVPSALKYSINISRAVVGRDNYEADKWTVPLTIMVSNNAAADSSFTYGKECLDPRFNWNPTNDSQWREENVFSLSNNNNWTTSYLYYAHDGSDGDTAMYIANEPLRSVGELGYLVYAPWKTIRLWGEGCDRVIDYFGFAPSEPNTYVTHSLRGCVNPNTEFIDSLAAVFDGLHIDEYPGGPFRLVSPLSARFIASQIMNREYLNMFYGAWTDKCIQMLSDTWAGPQFGAWEDGIFGVNPETVWITGLSFANELERESLIRNTTCLLSIYQNLFTIIIEAQPSYVGLFTLPQNQARKRAVAIVWRDPYTGEMFVRNIVMLED